MDKIIEISLAKIESCKSRKVSGKSTTLHKSLLVNTLLNRVRSGELETKDPLMNYREPKPVFDMDIDDFENEKIPAQPEVERLKNLPLQQKHSSLIIKLNTRSMGVEKKVLKKELTLSNNSFETIDCSPINIACECSHSATSNKIVKRPHIESDIDSVPAKRKCYPLWTTNVNSNPQDSCFAISSLAILFGDLVAHTEAESENIKLGSTFVSPMMAY